MTGFFILQDIINYNLDIPRSISNPIQNKKIISINPENLMEYRIGDGERPDQVSIRFYETHIYTWTILYVNNMRFSDWPLSSTELEAYIERKYGEKKNDTAYWKDKDGNIYLNQKYPKGFFDDGGNLVFHYVDKDKIGAIGTSNNPNVNEDLLFNTVAAKPVSFAEHEREKNESRKHIKLIRPELIEQFVKEYMET